MRKARKKEVIVHAYKLGEDNKKLDELMGQGLVSLQDDGSYEIHTAETEGGKGETAYAGDYVKLDACGRPYPNGARFFTAHHRHIQGDEYEQLTEEREVWTMGDEMCPEITFLLEQGKLSFHKEDPEHYFQGTGWGTKLSAASDAVVVFYEIRRDAKGQILDAEFNFVDRENFEKTYELLREKAPVQYDAFISYSHSEPDAYVARKLHTMLEHYKIPKRVQEISGKKKIERVFRDREELPLSANLAMGICEALEHSEYLIVICSPRSVKSEWVQREIETFLLTHGKDKVLTILTEGEPEEAFPEILCYEEQTVQLADDSTETVRRQIEPMAADVRGSDHREIDRKLKEELLRILAPMLSCTYDALKQRHRDYLFRRALIGVSGVAVIAVGFTVFALRQAAETQRQYQEARRNQARYLAGISGELLNTGDRMGALKTATAITPEDADADEPVVPEQMYALNEALYSYRNDDNMSYQPDKSYELSGKVQIDTKRQSELLSPDGSAMFCMDTLGNAYVMDVDAGTCIWKIEPNKLKDYSDGKFYWIAPMSDTQGVLVSQNEIRILDWKKQKVVSVIERQEEEKNYSDFTFAISGNTLGVTNSLTAWVYDLQQKVCTHQISYEADKTFSSVGGVLFNDDCSELLVYGSDPVRNDRTESKGIVKISLADEKVTCISDLNAEDIVYAGEHLVAAVQWEPVGEIAAVMDEKPLADYFVAVYDTQSGEMVWTSDRYEIQAVSRPCTIQLFEENTDEEKGELLLVSLKDRLLCMQPDTGEVMGVQTYSGDIVGVRQRDAGRYLIGLEDGRTYLFTSDNQMASDFRVGEIDYKTGGILFGERADVLIQTAEDGRTLTFSRPLWDDTMQEIQLTKAYGQVEYITVTSDEDQTVYRVVNGSENFASSPTSLDIYKAGSDKVMYRYRCGEDSQLENVQIRRVGERTCVLFYETDRGETMADLDTGKVLARQVLDVDGNSYQHYNVKSFHEAEKSLVYYDFSKQFAVTALTEKGIEVPTEKDFINADGHIENIQVSADDRYVAVEIQNPDGEGGLLKVWDVDKKCWKKLDGKTSYPITDQGVSLGKDQPLLAAYTRKGSIALLNLDSGACEQTLACGYYKNMQCAWVDQDQKLLSYGDCQYLTMWDVASGKMLMKDEDQEINGTLLTDTDSHYFGLVFNGYRWGDGEASLSCMKVYYVDDDRRFYAYADVPYGSASFDAKEIFVRSGAKGYYTTIYDYRELKERAEAVLDGETLTDVEKKQYFVSE